MTKLIRTFAVLAVAGSLAGAMGFAQSAGESVYKANCVACHGATGTPSAGIAKMMGVKPASDLKKLSVDEEIQAVKNGKGKMKAFGGKLTDAQIKDVVNYFRTL